MEHLLERVNQQYIEEFAPAIAIVCCILIIGLTGNILAAFYYGFKAPKTVVQVLMFVLALNDGIANLVAIDIVVVFFQFVTYQSGAACKLMRVLRQVFIVNSLLILVAIAGERFRRICFPFSSQFTTRNIRYVVVASFILSVLISSRCFVTADVLRINVTLSANATKGYFCLLSHIEVERVFSYIDISGQVAIVCSLIVFYSLVIRRIVKSKATMIQHRKHHEKAYQKHKRSSETLDGSTSVIEDSQISKRDKTSTENKAEDCSGIASTSQATLVQDMVSTITTDTSVDDAQSTSANGETKQHSTTLFELKSITVPNFLHNVKKLQTHGSKETHKDVRLKTEVRITIMVAVLTLASVLCFVPYYLSFMLIRDNLSGKGLIMSVGGILMRRSYILNSAINPIVLFVFDREFRNCIKKICHKKLDAS